LTPGIERRTPGVKGRRCIYNTPCRSCERSQPASTYTLHTRTERYLLGFRPMFRDKTKQLASVSPLFPSTYGAFEVFSRCPQRTSSRRSEAGRPGSARPLRATGDQVRKFAENRGTTRSRPPISRSTHTPDSSAGPCCDRFHPIRHVASHPFTKPAVLCLLGVFAVPTKWTSIRVDSASFAPLRFEPDAFPTGCALRALSLHEKALSSRSTWRSVRAVLPGAVSLPFALFLPGCRTRRRLTSDPAPPSLRRTR